MPSLRPRLAALAVLCFSILLRVGASPHHHKLPSFHALALASGTDKVTRHSYHHMYDHHLPRFRLAPVRFLEIGLGCDMGYGPGKSFEVWYNYFLHFNATLDFMDISRECVEKFHSLSTRGKMLVGDQGRKEDLQQVIDRAHQLGGYDIIVDDGGHQVSQQLLTFQTLWPLITPGGMFIIEDLETSYMSFFQGGPVGKPGTTISWIKSVIDMLNCRNQPEVPQPAECLEGLRDLHCFAEACVFTKAA